jgi:two-component system NtrC family sensor kinase
MKKKSNPGVLILIFFFSFVPGSLKSQKILELNDKITQNFIGQYLEILEDEKSTLNLNEVLKNNNFKSSGSNVPNLGVSSKSNWVKFTAVNLSGKKEFIAQLALATIDYVDYYAVYEDGRVDSVKTGDCRPFRNREFGRPDFAFKFVLNKNEKVKILFRLSSGEQLQAPIHVGEQTLIFTSFINEDVLMGIYFGIIFVMILYNTFIFFSTKDKSYLFYVIYILVVGITQLNFLGYTSKYLWPDSTYIANMAVYFLSSFTAICSIEFMKRFLFTKEKCPQLHKYFIVFYIFYYVAMALALFRQFNLSYQIIQINATFAASYILFVAWKISRQNYRPAKVFLLAWSTFLIGVCVFVMKDLGVLPYNNLTYYTMPIGSAFEVILLSFALADRINILSKEKEESQRHNLKLLEENERIITEQNITLESKVKERTIELEATNKSLNDTRAQLVNIEKMASIGQLTAGISHEINNPINFVVANVKPLKRDMDDVLMLLNKYNNITDSTGLDEKLKEINELKKQLDLDYTIEEINLLLKGIDEGANRTAEIVKGLKHFSRTDEAVLRKSDIHEGLDSTLSLLINNLAGANIKIVKNYSVLPQIDCYPGKLNQVFMNVINNAIHAIVAKKYTKDEGVISINTAIIENNLEIKIKDNGIGISKNNLTKVFEPFYTTKDVGQGTGLGLSIVYGIINSHNGKINILSEENEGAEFIITLPLQPQRV